MTEWKIHQRSGACSACERPFDDGERHVSCLRLTPDGLERGDHCISWWEGRVAGDTPEECARACGERQAAVQAQPDATGGDPAEVFWWYSLHQPAQKRTLQLDLESLERLFLELEGRGEHKLRELRYVLCLLLMRKRRLKLQQLLRDADGEAFLVKRPRRDETHKVYVFDFGVDRVAELRSELQTIFDGVDGDAAPDTAAGEGGDLSEAPQEHLAGTGDADPAASPPNGS